MTLPTLSCPDFDVPFILQTDASSVGLGVILTQKIGEREHSSHCVCESSIVRRGKEIFHDGAGVFSASVGHKEI